LSKGLKEGGSEYYIFIEKGLKKGAAEEYAAILYPGII
jgi:hypothetical protein